MHCVYYLLADEYECDVAMVKTKIKNLRTAFRRGSSPIKNKWFGYYPFLFLVDEEIARAGYSSK